MKKKNWKQETDRDANSHENEMRAFFVQLGKCEFFSHTFPHISSFIKVRKTFSMVFLEVKKIRERRKQREETRLPLFFFLKFVILRSWSKSFAHPHYSLSPGMAHEIARNELNGQGAQKSV